MNISEINKDQIKIFEGFRTYQFIFLTCKVALIGYIHIQYYYVYEKFHILVEKGGSITFP